VEVEVVVWCGVGKRLLKASLEFRRGVGPGGWVLYRIIMGWYDTLLGGGRKEEVWGSWGVGRVRACAVLLAEGRELLYVLGVALGGMDECWCCELASKLARA